MGIMKRLWLFAAALLVGAAIPLPGAPAYSFRRYTTRDGLSSNTVRALIQDRSGLIWMGTNGGLDSFDGRVIVHHLFPSGEDHPIRRILEDREGILWLGTENGVFRYMQDGTVHPVEELPPEWVCDLLEDRDGNVWIGMRNAGLFRWTDGSLTRFLDGHDIECLFESTDGRIWAASPTGKHRLYLFSGASDTIAPALLDYQDCSPALVNAMTQDPSGILWLGTWDRGLYTLDPETRTVRNPIPGGPGFTHIHSLTQIEPWHFLIGSDDGLLDLNPLPGDGGTLYGNDRRDPASLSNKFVYPVLQDHEGGIWIGTYYGGVNYASPFAGQFVSRSLSELVDAEENYNVSCFCEDPDGTVWMGSDNGGLFRYDPVSGKAQRWKTPVGGNDPHPAMNIHAIYRSGHDLWVGTFSRGLGRTDLRTGKTKVYMRDDGLLDSSVYSLAVDSEGTLWAGNLTGISRYDTSADRFVPEQETGFMIGAILPEPDGTVWFATEGKGLLCRLPNGDWKCFSLSSGDLPSDVVHCLLTIPDGICAGTDKGLVLVKDGKGSMLLEGEDIRYAAYDGTQLWISTSSSLIRHSLSTGASERFGTNDGIPGSLFFPASGLVAHDGRIFLGSLDGFVSFYPGSIHSNDVQPTVLITSFRTTYRNGKEQEVIFPGKTTPSLSWKIRDLRIGFASLSYCAPEKVRYSCRLEGMKPSFWKDLGNQNWVEYNGLPSGKYRLTVIASNNSGVWNREGVSIRFVIRPHPLRSGLAIFIYVLIGAALLFVGIRFLLLRANRKTQKQYARRLDEAVSLVKEDEIGDRVRLLSSLSSQLGAPVQGIGVQLERIKEHPKATSAVRAELIAIEKNQHMLRSISSNLERMLKSMARHPDSGAEDDSSRDSSNPADFLDRLNRLIQDHLADSDLSVPFLVQELAISKSSLFLKVKELTGETPNRLISLARLNKAAALLSEGQLSIAEIAFAVGFSSPSYFTKSFARQYGMTPHEWVARSKENRKSESE